MNEQENTMSKQDQGRKISEVINIIKNNTDRPDFERGAMIGFLIGMDFKAEAETISARRAAV